MTASGTMRRYNNATLQAVVLYDVYETADASKLPSSDVTSISFNQYEQNNVSSFSLRNLRTGKIILLGV